MIQYYPNAPETITLLEDRATKDLDEEVKTFAREELTTLTRDSYFKT